jgi:hypothetical protein
MIGSLCGLEDQQEKARARLTFSSPSRIRTKPQAPIREREYYPSGGSLLAIRNVDQFYFRLVRRDWPTGNFKLAFLRWDRFSMV